MAETKSSECRGCGKPLGRHTSPSSWCASCRSRRAARYCPQCGAQITTLYQAKCDQCHQPGRTHVQDARRKAERRARGLKGRKVYVWDGELLCAAEIARRAGVKPDALYRRLKKTDDIHEAVEAARRVS